MSVFRFPIALPKKQTHFLSLLFLATAMALTSGAAKSAELNLFSVLDYGAISGDGLSDFTASRSAIEAASTAGGGTVFYPCGTYTTGVGFWEGVFRINSGEDNIWIRGENKGCVFFEVHDGAINGIAIGQICPSNGTWTCGDGLGSLPVPQNITLSGITFRDNDPSSTASNNIEESHGIIIYCNRCKFYDIDMVQIGDEGFDIKHSKNITVRDSTCMSIGVPSGPGENSASCFNIQSSQNVTIDQGLCIDQEGAPASTSTSDCVRVEQFEDANHSKDIVIDGLATVNFPGTGLNINASLGPISQISMINSTINTIRPGQLAFDNVGGRTRKQVRLIGNTFRGPIYVGYTDSIVISNNLIETTWGQGIQLRQTHNAIISNNVISNTPEECIYLLSGSNASISMNHCVNVGGDGTSGIAANKYWFTTGTLDVISNTVDMAPGSNHGLDLLSDIPMAIRGNTIKHAGGYGILASGNITENRVLDSGSEGIFLPSGVHGALVANNLVDGAGDACIRGYQASATRVLGNRTANCTGMSIRFTEDDNSSFTQVMMNHVEQKIDASGYGSSCVGNLADGDVTCDGDYSITMANSVSEGFEVTGNQEYDSVSMGNIGESRY